MKPRILFLNRSYWPDAEATGQLLTDLTEDLADRFDVPGLWLGHFSGGRRDHHANGDLRVDWRSEYQCFFTAHACRAWRLDMKRAYRHYEGHGTCLPLRGGGKRIVHVVRGIKARY